MRDICLDGEGTKKSWSVEGETLKRKLLVILKDR